jgi:hypothetical protein
VAYGHKTFSRLRCWFFDQRYLFTMNSYYVWTINGLKFEVGGCTVCDLVLLHLRWHIRIFSFFIESKIRRDSLIFSVLGEYAECTLYEVNIPVRTILLDEMLTPKNSQPTFR